MTDTRIHHAASVIARPGPAQHWHHAMVVRLAALTLLSAVLLASAPAQSRGAPDSFADLAAKLLPSVVNISTTQVIKQREGGGPERPRFPQGSPFEDFFREFFDRQQRGAPQRRATSLGSGFIIDPSGLIVTNNHVIAEADEIMVTLADDTKLKAEVLGRDPKTDLALLRVKPQKPLAAVAFGNSTKMRVGDWVLAIGNPFGLGGTVTAGIISARGRDINSGPYDDFIQTDASINKGNSGGPMFNLKGEVVGVNTAIYSPSGGSVGIGFATPSNLAKPIVAQLEKFGRAKRGWLGVNIQTVTDEIAQGLGLPESAGALVANLTPGGPAEKGKIKVGDVILTFNGGKVDEMRLLPRMVAETVIGRKIPVVVWRRGNKVKLSVSVGEFPEDERLLAVRTPSKQSTEGDVTLGKLGLVLSPVTPELRARYKLGDKAKGVVVTKVEDGSPAAEKRIQPGDLISKVGPEHAPVSRPSQVKAHVDKAREAEMKSIILLVEREGATRFVGLKLEKS